jgi:hypothetical protein
MAYETAKSLNNSLEDSLQTLVVAEALSSIDLFFERFHANLQQGQVRIIFFLEDSSLQLRSIAYFLNKQMERAEVLVVEARQYRHNESRIIVPNLIGYTDQIRLSKKTVAVNPASSRPPMTREALLASIAQRNLPEVAKVAQDIVSSLEHLGLATRSFPSCINYGVEVDGDFLSIVSLYPKNIWLAIPNRATERLDAQWFRSWKEKVNTIAKLYKPECVSEPTNKGALGPRYETLKGKSESFIDAVRDLRNHLKGTFAAGESS